MRTDSFSQEKHLPVRRFIADESKVATGLYGPRAIAEDLDNLCTMFDPEADILDGTQKGGISEQNLQDGAVSYHKLHESLQQKIDSSADKEELEQAETELSRKLETKAEKANTLLGYGIRDAYTITEIDRKLLFKQNASDDSLETEDKTVVGAINEICARQRGVVGQTQCHFNRLAMQEAIDKKLQETVLHEVTINTHPWLYQTAVIGTLDSHFNTTDYYYVTLKNTDGTPLPTGQFKLMDFYDQYADAYDTVFRLGNLDEVSLKENIPVEFVEIGTNFVRMRTAGVSMATINIGKNFQSDIRCITTKVNGSFIKMAASHYFNIYYTTSKNVSNYHSGAATTWNADATKNIWHYINLGSDGYKENRYTDELTLIRHGIDQFQAFRKTLLRALPYGKTEYKHYSANTVGFGSIPEENTLLSTVCVCAVNGNGFLRNGTVITVTEVK